MNSLKQGLLKSVETLTGCGNCYCDVQVTSQTPSVLSKSWGRTFCGRAAMITVRFISSANSIRKSPKPLKILVIDFALPNFWRDD